MKNLNREYKQVLVIKKRYYLSAWALKSISTYILRYCSKIINCPCRWNFMRKLKWFYSSISPLFVLAQDIVHYIKCFCLIRRFTYYPYGSWHGYNLYAWDRSYEEWRTVKMEAQAASQMQFLLCFFMKVLCFVMIYVLVMVILSIGF